MTHLVLVVVVGLPFSFCCFAINLIRLFKRGAHTRQSIYRKFWGKSPHKQASFWSPFMIPLWLQLIATRWHSIAFKAFLLLFGNPGSHMKPYLISMPEFASFLHSTSVQLHWRQDTCTYLSLPPASWEVGKLGNTPGWWCPQPPWSFYKFLKWLKIKT